MKRHMFLITLVFASQSFALNMDCYLAGPGESIYSVEPTLVTDVNVGIRKIGTVGKYEVFIARNEGFERTLLQLDNGPERIATMSKSIEISLQLADAWVACLPENGVFP